MDIIVTTPLSERANAAQEAADCIRDGGGEYFRRFPRNLAPDVRTGDRVYYVEDGWIRGYALVARTRMSCDGWRCETTGRRWGPGLYVFMAAASWVWIRPIPMRGFQGFRYAGRAETADGQRICILAGHGPAEVVVVGNWLDPKPETPQ